MQLNTPGSRKIRAHQKCQTLTVKKGFGMSRSRVTSGVSPNMVIVLRAEPSADQHSDPVINICRLQRGKCMQVTMHFKSSAKLSCVVADQ